MHDSYYSNSFKLNICSHNFNQYLKIWYYLIFNYLFNYYLYNVGIYICSNKWLLLFKLLLLSACGNLGHAITHGLSLREFTVLGVLSVHSIPRSQFQAWRLYEGRSLWATLAQILFRDLESKLSLLFIFIMMLCTCWVNTN